MFKKTDKQITDKFVDKMSSRGFECLVITSDMDRMKTAVTLSMQKETLAYAIYKMLSSINDASISEAVVHAAIYAHEKLSHDNCIAELKSSFNPN